MRTVLTVPRWSLVFGFALLGTGCTVTRVNHADTATYVPPPPREVSSAKKISKPVDLVWDSTLRFFAKEDVVLNSADKLSGIIAGEKIYTKGAQEVPFDTGKYLIRRAEIVETLKPHGFVSSGVPDYVRQYGKVVDRKENVTYEELACQFNANGKFNVFLKAIDSQNTSVEVKVKVVPMEVILDNQAPSPISNGSFENALFLFLDAEAASRE